MRSMILLAVAVSLLACADQTSEPAAACAEAVRVHLGLQRPVGVKGHPRQTSEGSVEIEYEGMDGMNLPAEGTAECTFAVGDAGELQLMEATVNGQMLKPAELASVRSTLGKSR